MIEYTMLLARISARVRHEGSSLLAPIVGTELAEAESRLGFALHPLLANVYQQIADGGFGPGYQLLRLLDGDAETVVSAYLTNRASGVGSGWAWPEGVVPILTWGCGMYACVDCRSDEGTVLLFEPNLGDPDAAWFIDTTSLAQWFEHYLDDTGWWVKAEDGEDVDDMPLWLHARERAS
ncbi:SMI1/KNR4 family protein [Nocardia sp. NPDC004604]|uniref:SMI1/KNR4 family protein n=1 Tax=Nocardia sp. NPDC004604 TaxID=3157013 RepID=UPI0033B5FBF9